jgi:hypothetical protein
VETKKLEYIRIWVEVSLLYQLFLFIKSFIRQRDKVPHKVAVLASLLTGILLLDIFSRIKNVRATKISLLIAQVLYLFRLVTGGDIFDESKSKGGIQ